MNTLLCILSHGKADHTLSRHMPYYIRTGYDIQVSSPRDDRSNVGVGFGCGLSQHHGRETVMRYYETFRTAYQLDYSHYIFIEYDCVLFNKPPEHPGGRMMAHVFYDNNPQGFRGHYFPHCPWYFDSPTLMKWLDAAAKEIAKSEFEQGFPDRFIGWVCENNNIPFQQHKGTYSQNTLDQDWHIQEANQAYRNGAWAIHGIKTQQQLEGVIG